MRSSEKVRHKFVFGTAPCHGAKLLYSVCPYLALVCHFGSRLRGQPFLTCFVVPDPIACRNGAGVIGACLLFVCLFARCCGLCVGLLGVRLPACFVCLCCLLGCSFVCVRLCVCSFVLWLFGCVVCVCLLVCVFAVLFVGALVCLFVCLLVCLLWSVCLSACLSVCLSVWSLLRLILSNFIC